MQTLGTLKPKFNIKPSIIDTFLVGNSECFEKKTKVLTSSPLIMPDFNQLSCNKATTESQKTTESQLKFPIKFFV